MVPRRRPTQGKSRSSFGKPTVQKKKTRSEENANPGVRGVRRESKVEASAITDTVGDKKAQRELEEKTCAPVPSSVVPAHEVPVMSKPSPTAAASVSSVRTPALQSAQSPFEIGEIVRLILSFVPGGFRSREERVTGAEAQQLWSLGACTFVSTLWYAASLVEQVQRTGTTATIALLTDSKDGSEEEERILVRPLFGYYHGGMWSFSRAKDPQSQELVEKSDSSSRKASSGGDCLEESSTNASSGRRRDPGSRLTPSKRPSRRPTGEARPPRPSFLEETRRLITVYPFLVHPCCRLYYRLDGDIGAQFSLRPAFIPVPGRYRRDPQQQQHHQQQCLTVDENSPLLDAALFLLHTNPLPRLLGYPLERNWPATLQSSTGSIALSGTLDPYRCLRSSPSVLCRTVDRQQCMAGMSSLERTGGFQRRAVCGTGVQGVRGVRCSPSAILERCLDESSLRETGDDEEKGDVPQSCLDEFLVGRTGGAERPIPKGSAQPCSSVLRASYLLRGLEWFAGRVCVAVYLAPSPSSLAIVGIPIWENVRVAEWKWILRCTLEKELPLLAPVKDGNGRQADFDLLSSPISLFWSHYGLLQDMDILGNAHVSAAESGAHSQTSRVVAIVEREEKKNSVSVSDVDPMPKAGLVLHVDVAVLESSVESGCGTEALPTLYPFERFSIPAVPSLSEDATRTGARCREDNMLDILWEKVLAPHILAREREERLSSLEAKLCPTFSVVLQEPNHAVEEYCFRWRTLPKGLAANDRGDDDTCDRDWKRVLSIDTVKSANLKGRKNILEASSSGFLQSQSKPDYRRENPLPLLIAVVKTGNVRVCMRLGALDSVFFTFGVDRSWTPRRILGHCADLLSWKFIEPERVSSEGDDSEFDHRQEDDASFGSSDEQERIISCFRQSVELNHQGIRLSFDELEVRYVSYRDYDHEPFFRLLFQHHSGSKETPIVVVRLAD